ncbi:unnamed protein product [Mytilus edulis]|uniref:U5 small nuclear ribonucleoprotein TSSC4 n=1 Tax=Mytilus edulis TaxID=6550 RepID=A0A8S3V3I9_MYTED|nr:unnamed protein product [Mytilus edulis]
MSRSQKEVDPYTIKSSTDSFETKAKGVFDCLLTLEDKHKAYEKARKDSSDESDLLKDEPSKEEIETIKPAFKQPRPVGRGQTRGSYSRRPFKRGSRMPDFNDGPAKWKKYSLEDVDVMNDASNKQAAYAFLEERRKQREGEITETKADIQSMACSKGQFTFSKRAKNDNTSEKEKKDEQSSSEIKQRLELTETETEIKEDVDKDQDKNPTETVFKSRKFGKRNIRSRERNDDDDGDT